MENPNPWWPLVGVLVGGLLGGGGLVLRDHLKFRRERKALAAAIGAEIRAILEHAEQRDYETHFGTYLENWKKGQGHTSRPIIAGMVTFEDARREEVFDASVEKLRLLGADVAADVIRFYSTLKGIKVDLVQIAAETRIQHCIDLLGQDLNLWQDVKTLGSSLQNRLAKL